MKISIKQELQQIAFNHSSDLKFKDFMNSYEKKCKAKPYSFSVVNCTLMPNNLSTFQKESFRKNIKATHADNKMIIRLEIKICHMILTKKQRKDKHYHHVKLINMNILQVKKYCLLIKVEIQKKLVLLILL